MNERQDCVFGQACGRCRTDEGAAVRPRAHGVLLVVGVLFLGLTDCLMMNDKL